MAGDTDVVLSTQTHAPTWILFDGVWNDDKVWEDQDVWNDTDPLKGSVIVNFDISFDSDGDILTDDFFDTSLLYSILGERRADPSEVVEPQLRRGWIGNEDKDFENGSKIWLFEQSRVTRSNLNRIEDEARKALQWLVDDGLVVSVDEVTTAVKNGKITLEIVIRRSRSQVERRFFDLWENTGLRSTT